MQKLQTQTISVDLSREQRPIEAYRMFPALGGGAEGATSFGNVNHFYSFFLFKPDNVFFSNKDI